jgi:hypothetical protein
LLIKVILRYSKGSKTEEEAIEKGEGRWGKEKARRNVRDNEK